MYVSLKFVVFVTAVNSVGWVFVVVIAYPIIPEALSVAFIVIAFDVAVTFEITGFSVSIFPTFIDA